MSSLNLLAHVSTVSEENFESIGDRPQTELIKSRLNNLTGVLDIQYHSEIRSRILQYTVSSRKSTEALLGRAMQYFPLFEEKLREKDLPQDLKYVAVIESMLRPTAKSRVGAYGLWQFMPATGRMYGLNKDRYLDQRADPELATEAAVQYLSDLYDQFGDWTVAIAAYNCGPGNVRKAIRRSGKTDFWGMKRYLPKETQKYVPRVIAASYLMNYYHSHDLTPRGYAAVFQDTETVIPDENMSLKEVSKSLNLDLESLRELNPMYKGDRIVGNKSNILRLPSNRVQMYYAVYDQEQLESLLAVSDAYDRHRKYIDRDSTDQMARLVAAYQDEADLQALES